MTDIAQDVASQVSYLLANKGVIEKQRKDVDNANITLFYEGLANQRKGFTTIDYYHWAEESGTPRPDVAQEAERYANEVIRQIVAGGVEWP